MEKEQCVLHEETETVQPEETKTKKYIRIVFGLAGMAFFVLVFVMAAIRRYGG
jgi:hypothetical protein